MTYQGLIHRYGQYLDLPAHTKNISLLEGNTPLIPMPRLSRELGCELFIKFEGLNPTGSFKDRGMTAAISEAVGRGAKTVICASTGNTAASAAAYASRAGLRSIVLIPEGKVAAGKLAGAIAYGAEVIQIQGSFDDALSLTGLIVTKLDGTAKGGVLAALAAGAQGCRPVPVYWIGVGEQLEDLQPFVAREFALAMVGESAQT